jgi:hypothetical protein
MVTQHIKIFGIETNLKIIATIDRCKFNILKKPLLKNKYLILNVEF